MSAPAWRFYSGLKGARWPAVPTATGAAVLALASQLDRTQWLPAAELRTLQFKQLEALLRHAFETVPYYRERWHGVFREPLTPERFAQLPIVTRAELQERFDAFCSSRIPSPHGAIAETRTSGSTGQPVRVLKTELTQLIWRAVLLREHQWFRRDLRGKLVSIRQTGEEKAFSNWGAATDRLVQTGPAATLPIRADVDSQIEWLQRHDPEYLLTYPSNLRELIRRSQARDVRFARLREVRTFGEILPAETREACRRSWGLPVVDMYSSDEAGYLALQCPEHEHYHVQSEGVLLEVLDKAGRACGPGETGRVVVTALHNFATPLVRYDLQDYAEVGSPCACGRGLPVLNRIVGRARNMLTAPDGRKYWPALGTRVIADVAPIRQYQLVQKSPGLVEARVVPGSPWSAEQAESVRLHLESRMPPGVRVTLIQCDGIPRSAGGKFEDFLSEIRDVT